MTKHQQQQQILLLRVWIICSLCCIAWLLYL